MTHNHQSIIWGCIALLAYSGWAMAEPTMQFNDFRIIEPPAVARHAAAYGNLTNTGRSEDTLVAVQSQVAQATELHETKVHKGKASMHAVTRFALKSGDTLTFKPQSYHVMFKGLKQPLKASDVVRLIFVFEKSGAIAIKVPVLHMPSHGGHL